MRRVTAGWCGAVSNAMDPLSRWPRGRLLVALPGGPSAGPGVYRTGTSAGGVPAGTPVATGYMFTSAYAE